MRSSVLKRHLQAVAAPRFLRANEEPIGVKFFIKFTTI